MNRIPNRIPHQEIIAPAEEGALHENHAAGAPLAHQIAHLSFVLVAPDREKHQELISTTDHIMQLIGNPVRTLLALSENASCCTDTSIGALQVLNPNELTISHRNLMEVRDQLRSMELSILRFRNQNLPEYRICLECFNHAEEAFDHALQLLHNKKTPWSEYTDAIQSAAGSFTAFATSVGNLSTAQAAATALIPPGAYHISAEEAAREGSFYYHEPLPPREPVEAIPVNLPVGHLQPLPETDPALRFLRKAPYRPDGLPIVQAEAPMMMVHGIPIAEATIVPQMVS